MGANAQTAVPAFTAGQVLTAAQQTQINTGVPVFATTTTRDAAFGGSGQKTLAQGQLAYIENISGSSAVQYYTGAAWATLVTGGVNVVKSETAFTTATSVTADNVFSSTYTNYLMIVRYSTSGGTGVTMRVRAGGSSVSTATYNQHLFASASTSNTASDSGGLTSIELGVGNVDIGIIVVWISGINLAAKTVISSKNTKIDSSNVASTWTYDGVQTNATAYDGIELISNTMTGTYTIYGMSK